MALIYSRRPTKRTHPPCACRGSSNIIAKWRTLLSQILIDRHRIAPQWQQQSNITAAQQHLNEAAIIVAANYAAILITNITKTLSQSNFLSCFVVYHLYNPVPILPSAIGRGWYQGRDCWIEIWHRSSHKSNARTLQRDKLCWSILVLAEEVLSPLLKKSSGTLCHSCSHMLLDEPPNSQCYTIIK